MLGIRIPVRVDTDLTKKIWIHPEWDPCVQKSWKGKLILSTPQLHFKSSLLNYKLLNIQELLIPYYIETKQLLHVFYK
jgi:hypothetical protein